MPTPRTPLVFLAVALLPACDRPSADTGPTGTTTVAHTAAPATTGTTTGTTAAADGQTVGHVRVSVKKVSIGKVALKAADGSITHTDEPRLMIAVRIENVSDKKQSGYNTWVPDLDAAKTVARLTDDRGAELKRVTFGFGNNVQGRTVLDTLTPGKVIGDLLVFEPPTAGVKHLDLELPGANCGVKGTFQFRIDAATIGRAK